MKGVLYMNTDKTRLTIMNGLEVKKGILDNCKIIDCKNEKSNKLYKKILENDIIEEKKHKKE